jgi:hypothetical protein
MSFLNWSSSFYGAKVFLIKSITLRVWKKVDLAGASSLRLMKLDLAGASSLRLMKCRKRIPDAGYNRHRLDDE